VQSYDNLLSSREQLVSLRSRSILSTALFDVLLVINVDSSYFTIYSRDIFNQSRFSIDRDIVAIAQDLALNDVNSITSLIKNLRIKVISNNVLLKEFINVFCKEDFESNKKQVNNKKNEELFIVSSFTIRRFY